MKLRNGLLVLGTAGLLVSGMSLVGAQSSSEQQTIAQTQNWGFGFGGPSQGGRGHGHGGFRDGDARGFHGGPGGMMRGGFGPLGHLAKGTEVTATFYDANPDEGGTVLETLTLTVGQDSEMSFAQAMREALQTASYLKINTSAQSRTLELNSDTTNLGPHGGFIGIGLNHLNLGSSVEAIFYNGDPANGGTITTNLNFVAGTDSELAFRNAFDEARADASHVVINSSAQERIIDLSQLPLRSPGMRHQ